MRWSFLWTRTCWVWCKTCQLRKSRLKWSCSYLCAGQYGIQEIIFEGKKEDSQISLAKAKAIVKSYRKIKPPPLPSYAEQNYQTKQTWKPPPLGCFKVNVGAATKIQNQVAGLGVIIRNAEGKFIAAAQNRENFSGDVLAAEAKAIQLGIAAAKAAKCRPVIIESDCQEVIDLITRRKCSKTEISWIISDIIEDLKKLNNATLQHTSRLGNDMAHSIPKMALRNVESEIWTDVCPPHLLYLFHF